MDGQLNQADTQKTGPARRCTGNCVPQPEAVDLDMSQNWLVALSSTGPRDCDPFNLRSITIQTTNGIYGVRSCHER